MAKRAADGLAASHRRPTAAASPPSLTTIAGRVAARLVDAGWPRAACECPAPRLWRGPRPPLRCWSASPSPGGSSARPVCCCVGSAWIPIADANATCDRRFAAWSACRGWRSSSSAPLPHVGHFTAYSGDDWLTYQVAGDRIFMHGFWLEGGSSAFDYQPLYRWISGGLHVVFGDSSVGETYLDAACLLAGALLAFALVHPVAGFRAALLACTGDARDLHARHDRGISSGAVCPRSPQPASHSAAACSLLRARLRPPEAAAAAGFFAVLMFYTRLNHLLFAVSLLALLLPLSTSTRLSALARGVRQSRSRSAAIYARCLRRASRCLPPAPGGTPACSACSTARA